jgi:predicted site-specific integrase-resolvase
MKAGYARVSTKDQAVDLQVDALKKAGCTNVYTEVMSGTRAERPILSSYWRISAPETFLSFGSSIASVARSNI